MTALAAHPLNGLLADAIKPTGLRLRSVQTWDWPEHRDPRPGHDRVLRVATTVIECRVIEDMGRYFGACVDSRIADDELARWFADRLVEMVAEPGSWTHARGDGVEDSDGLTCLRGWGPSPNQVPKVGMVRK